MPWFPRSKKWTGWELNPRPQLSTTYLKGRNVKENFLELKSRPVHSFLCVFRSVVSQTKFLEKARYRHTSIKKYREGIKQVLVLYYALIITSRLKTGAGTSFIWAATVLKCGFTGWAVCECFLNYQDLYCYNTY
jgi:hypothetical protein